MADTRQLPAGYASIFWFHFYTSVSLASMERTRPWSWTCIPSYFVFQSMKRHHKPQHCETEREERAGLADREQGQRWRGGWKDGWRKKLHRGGHLITASDVNINRSGDEAARRCERHPPPPPKKKKQPCKKEGKKKLERTEGSRDTVTHFDSHCKHTHTQTTTTLK